MSQVEVDKVIPQSGTTLTIGDSGDTVTIPSGATLAIAGSVTGFTSAGIDDNATSVAITINSSEQVGIGTTSPDHLLHISASSSNAQLKLQRTGSATATYNISASSDGLAFSNQVTGSEVMRITSTGLGIGTSSPDTTLSLEQNNAPRIQYKDTSGGTDAKVWRTMGLDSDYRLETRSDNLSNGQLAYVVTRSGYVVNEHKFYTTDSERLRITSDGKVGIGTTNPNRMLTVEGDGGEPDISLVNLDNSNNNFNQIRFLSVGSDDSTRRLGADIKALYTSHSSTNPTTDLVFGTASGSSPSAERMRINSSGQVGIGTTSPDAKLDVATGSSGAIFRYDTASTFLSILPEDANGDVSLRFRANSGSAPDLLFKSDNGSEVVRIGNNGNVGIGTSSPDYSLEVAGTGLFGGSVMATGSTTTTASRRAIMTHDGSSMKLMASGDSVHRNMIFYRDGGDDEAMRIDTSNRLMIGTTNTTFNAQLTVNSGTSLRSQDGYNGNPPVRMFMGTDFTGGLFVEFTSSTGARLGSITRASSTSIAFNTTSDYRLKENVVDLDNATARLKQLQPKRFNFISDADTTVDGFLAHEVSNIVPEAVTGEKDEIRDFGNIVDENNNIIEENVNENYEKEDGHTWVKTGTKPVYQGIDQSKLVPLLVKTIQELEARITTLENA